ncbi:hypothetical protein BMETH_2692_0 [methanotrophic bacterial endosymbiont of Bathymodiolus sp.]|nr:hypothetical protein BMETH_2692_0 [methanotrophic bacterial endosymbiont of Bathymodiolus sp.]
MIAQDLASSLNLSVTQKNEVIRILKQNREATIAVIDKYPTYFRERMNEILR